MRPPSSRSFRRDAAGAREPLLEIPDQVVDVLDADGEPDRAGANAGRFELVFGELPVRRARGMNYEALRIADVGEMRPQRDRANEFLTRVASAADVEREHRARAARQILLDERPIPARAES